MNTSAINTLTSADVNQERTSFTINANKTNLSKKIASFLALFLTGLFLKTYLALSWVWYFTFKIKKMYKNSFSIKTIKTIPTTHYQPSFGKAA